MHDLTLEEILAIHAGIMAQDGGDTRVLSEGNLHQTIFRANLPEDPFARAATAFYSLAAYPAFRDGNKRTAQAVAEKILAGEGYTLPDNDPGWGTMSRGIMDFTVEIGEIEEYFRKTAAVLQGTTTGTPRET
ncbi:Fic family protein [uncultured Methanoregula sp.]|uniref:Fic family protein n=1 Tax=uncultured Methanoregula sp. TaxID=1005933 RepID=UPI002AAA9AD4|nr:Fic family protein [uncultured Methanoregula sp.]